MSFEAHYYLVSIHPWVDGNGRMARLVMNQIQWEFGVLPSKVLKEHKIGYIQSLQDARERDDVSIFCQFMLNEHIVNVQNEMDAYRKSMRDDVVIKGVDSCSDVVINARESQVLECVKAQTSVTTARLAEQLSISSRQVQRILSSLKHKGLIRHEGSNKSGKWMVKTPFALAKRRE